MSLELITGIKNQIANLKRLNENYINKSHQEDCTQMRLKTILKALKQNEIDLKKLFSELNKVICPEESGNDDEIAQIIDNQVDYTLTLGEQIGEIENKVTSEENPPAIANNGIQHKPFSFQLPDLQVPFFKDNGNNPCEFIRFKDAFLNAIEESRI